MSELISGKEALIALANGEDVEYLEDDNKWNLIDKEFVVISALIDCKLRLKPKTITLNGVEIPAPFDPKKEEEYFYISDEYDGGYGVHKHDNSTIEIAAWRTEDEIKQVVAALRSVFNAR